MKITITLTRSSEYVAQKRLETGDNVPETVDVETEVAELSAESRRALLAVGGGRYTDRRTLTFSSDRKLSPHSDFGRATFQSDAESPTAADVDAAIRGAIREFEQKRAEWEARQAEIRAENERKAAENARRDEARELLADEIGSLGADRNKAEANLRVLAEFLVAIPRDSKRGTLKRLCLSDEAIAERQRAIEDASPVWIFEDDD